MSQDTTQDLNTVRHTALFDALSAQRNNAMNEVVNLAAENALLRAMLEKQNLKIAELETKANSATQ